MRNYNFEIRELSEDIKELKVATAEKERKLNRLLKKKHSTEIQKEDSAPKDQLGKPIAVHDWVKVVTKGKFKSTEGKLRKIAGKWVMCLDASSVKQVRASRDLIVVEDVGHNSGTTSNRRG